jgi:glycolate oxidase iron-sulfur subunit
MQTNLQRDAHDQTAPRAAAAEAILRSCVHCGFCNATCPTYQVLGDELDGPRGRIYLIKQMLEGGDASETTQTHLDRCLTCRSCETTCPSGVQYHTLLDIGREEVERRVPRAPLQRLLRATLRFVLTRPRLFRFAVTAGRLFRPLLPEALRNKVPRSATPPGARPVSAHRRRMLILEGCVQPSLSPNTNAAAARVLDRLGIELVSTPAVRCCGAIDYHLEARAAGLAHARRNIDAWWPAVESGVEAIVQTASGCGAFVKDYAEMLAGDADYAAKAERISAMARDLVEILAAEPLEKLSGAASHPGALAFHCPCTLQHAQKLGGAVESVLARLGFKLAPVRDGHLCCGSAGTYSVTQPVLATELRDRKLTALQESDPTLIVTANIGCQVHLGSAARVPVTHWIELVDRLGGTGTSAAPDTAAGAGTRAGVERLAATG